MPHRPRVPQLLAGLLIVSALAAVLALTDHPRDSYPEQPPPPPVEPFDKASPAEIAARLEAIRLLEFEEVPEVQTLSAAEWRKKTKKMADRGPKGAKEQAESEAVEDFLKLSGLATPDFEVEQATEGVGELIGGFYRPKANRLVLVESPFMGDRAKEKVIAHEFEHALQDQNYPKALKLGAVTGEGEIALSALVEGDASVVERRYARRYLETDTLDADKSLLSPANLAVGLPPALVASVRFPYTAGADFVAALRRRGGWELVDEAFEDPPTTSEQILHPGKWFAGEDGAKVETPPAVVLGADWTSVASVESGELDALVILASGVPANVAERAAKGWEGGRFESYRLDGVGGEECKGVCREGRASAVVYTWETEEEAAQFAIAARSYLSTRLTEGKQGGPTFELAAGAATISLEGRSTGIAYAPSGALSRKLAAAAVAEPGS